MGFAFIVDGQTEKKILQHVCPDAPIRMTNLNGKDVSVVAIAKPVSSLLKLLKDRYYPVLILVDREDRELSSERIEAELTQELAGQHGICADNIVVSCPDRMIENWILSDPTLLKTLLDIDCPTNLEGCAGKGLLKRLLASKNMSYHELTIGVQLFIKIDPRSARTNSASFRRMADRVDHSCRWLRFN
jgi:hypothetical protein